MTFWDAMRSIWAWIEGHITRILALSLGTVTALLTTGVIPPNDVKWYMAAITLLTYWRGEATNNTYQVAKAVVATSKQITAETPPPPSPAAAAITAADQPATPAPVPPAVPLPTARMTSAEVDAIASAVLVKFAAAQKQARERVNPLAQPESHV